MGPQRIGAEDVRRKQLAGEPILLVSACDRRQHECLHLEGAVAFEDLEAPLGKGHEIVFYASDEKEAERHAEAFYEKGYVNAKVLDGGIAAWKRAGFPVALGT